MRRCDCLCGDVSLQTIEIFRPISVTTWLQSFRIEARVDQPLPGLLKRGCFNPGNICQYAGDVPWSPSR